MPHLFRRHVVACLATVLLLGLSGVSPASVDRSPVEVLDGDELRDVIAFLENETFRDDQYVQMRVSMCGRLSDVVREGGDGLRHAALERVRTGDAAQRQHAQLVLAQCAEIPDDELRPLLSHPDPEVWIWAHVTACRLVEDRGDDVGMRSVEMAAAAGPLTQIPARLPDDEPLIAVAGEIEARLRVSPEVDARRRAADPEQHGRRFEPLLTEFWKYIPRDRRRFVDFEGDGVDEVVVVAYPKWGDHESEFRCDELKFVAVIGRDADGVWQLEAFDAIQHATYVDDIFVGDVDGNDGDECFVRTKVIGGWCWGVLNGVTRAAVGKKVTASFPDQVVSCVGRPGGDDVFFVAAEAYRPTHSGKAAYLAGTMAYEYVIHRWNGSELELVGAVYVP